MSVNLCIDVGNTRTKVGEFNGNELIQVHTLDNEDVLKNSMMLDEMSINALILSSVNETVSSALKLHDKDYPCIELDYSTPLPIKISYQTPETLGKDRIALAVAGASLFPNKAVLVIDAGTCITYDLVNENREYLGGAISPGVQMRLKSMHFGTDSLPLLQWNADSEDSPSAIGKSTITSMLSGAVNGIKGEMMSFIESSSEYRSELNVIISGGDAEFFEKELKNGIFADPNLVLKGLNEILLYNLEN